MTQLLIFGFLHQWSPAILAPRTGFTEDSFPWTQVGDGFGMIQVRDIHCALCFSCRYVSSTVECQALERGGWRPCSTWLITENYESEFTVLEHLNKFGLSG